MINSKTIISFIIFYIFSLSLPVYAANPNSELHNLNILFNPQLDRNTGFWRSELANKNREIRERDVTPRYTATGSKKEKKAIMDEFYKIKLKNWEAVKTACAAQKTKIYDQLDLQRREIFKRYNKPFKPAYRRNNCYIPKPKYG
ncbi:MAG: hypothetical protein ACR2QW_00300 [bacterium]